MTQLYAAIRRGKVKPGMAQEFANRVRAGALPVMKTFDDASPTEPTDGVVLIAETAVR